MHDLDEPADLRVRLEARGLRSHHAEALMVLDVQRAPLRRAVRDEVVIERATGPTLDAVAAFQEEIWECSLPWLAAALHDIASRDSAVVLHARVGPRIVGSGWIEFAEGSRFAQLHGGAVLESFRGRGIYTRLCEARLEEAKRRDARVATSA